MIRYRVAASRQEVVWTSEPGPGPRFRLRYRPSGSDEVAVRFEIASDDRATFATYVEGAAPRRAS